MQRPKLRYLGGPGQAHSRNVRSSAAIGYLEGAGGTGGIRAVVATGDGEIRTFTGSGVQLFDKKVSDYGIWSSPIISDMDGDQEIEIAVGCDHRVYVLEAAAGDTISDYREEVVTKCLIYRGDESYESDWSTQAGEAAAPETTCTERSGTVGDIGNSAFYRVKAEDMHGNRSALSNATYGEHEFSTEGQRRDRKRQRNQF